MTTPTEYQLSIIRTVVGILSWLTGVAALVIIASHLH